MTLFIPNAYKVINTFISIDPGTNFMGISIFKVDSITFEIISIYSYTIKVESLPDMYISLSDTFSERFSKILKIKSEFISLLNKEKPFAIIAEAPFFNRLRPGAFSPLVEVLNTLRLSAYEYDPMIDFMTPEPSVVKKLVDAGHIANKDMVKAAVLSNNELSSKCITGIDNLDEHSIDSIAVGWAYLKWIRQGL